MERRGGTLGVQPKPGKQRRRERKLAKSLMDYLTSDSYMYAPLLDSSTPPFDCSPVQKIAVPPPRPSDAFCRIEVERTSLLQRMETQLSDSGNINGQK